MTKFTLTLFTWVSFFFVLMIPGSSHATTIIPFSDLGHVAVASEAVVLARVDRNYQATEGDATFFRIELTVLDKVSGPIGNGEQIHIQRLYREQQGMIRMMENDLELEEGTTYLLYLDQLESGYWAPLAATYYVMQQHERNGQNVLVPLAETQAYHLAERPDGESVEPLGVFYTEQLTHHLKQVTTGRLQWNRQLAEAPFAAETFYLTERAAPGHCSFLRSTYDFRWNVFSSSSVHVYADNDPDPSFAGAQASVASAVTTLGTSYSGINLVSMGTTNFNHSCSGNSVVNSNMTGYMNGLNGSNTTLVVFNDPCSEIPNLNGCSGTLAQGGSYASGTHQFDNQTWFSSRYGYVVVNNGSGCLGGSGYARMMEHELTHTLGIGHIASGNGAANMNPSCCRSISSLDIQCLNYTYPTALPVELTDFDGAQYDKVNHLIWETATEYENDYFTLERSSDGVHYEAISTITGAGTSLVPLQYEFTDQQPFYGVNYYRLRQTDLDGTETVAGEIAIQFYDGFQIDLFPNPVSQSSIQLEWNTEQGGEVEHRVFDLNGRLVYQSVGSVERGRNRIELPVEDFPKGMYLLEASQNGYVYTQRFVRQ